MTARKAIDVVCDQGVEHDDLTCPEDDTCTCPNIQTINEADVAIRETLKMAGEA